MNHARVLRLLSAIGALLEWKSTTHLFASQSKWEQYTLLSFAYSNRHPQMCESCYFMCDFTHPLNNLEL